MSTGGMSIYELPQQVIAQDYINKIATVQVGPETTHLTVSPGKVLMVVGATGAGKTTLINAMVNYLFGVEWEDDFRFKMIVEEAAKDQTKSVTKWITAYTIPAQEGSPVPYTFTIIDTPGFGDTEGVERDKLIVKQFEELFSKKGPGGIDQLHGIGFVVQSALARLTHTQRYIFDSILAIFGKDVEKNVFMMTTFADGQRPPVLKAVKAANVPYKTHFKFNNCALYSDDKTGEIDRIVWEMGMANMKKFFIMFETLPPTNLQLTREVLEVRHELEVILNTLFQGLHVNKYTQQSNQIRARKYIERLDEICLRQNPLYDVEFIDLLIESVREEMRPGFIQQVEVLKNLRHRAELISRLPTM